jgi:hypothetical protein
LISSEGTVCVFCGADLDHTWRMTVHLTDGVKFHCCPVACGAMVAAIESRRHEVREAAAARQQIALPLGAA